MPQQAAAPAEQAFSFGPFRLLPARQLLLESDQPLRIGSRALDILIALVDRPGELVSKDDLIARAWPNTVVDESNLRAQVAALRKALGDGRAGTRYIATVPGRGYRFVAPVSRSENDTVRTGGAGRRDTLPARLTRAIGRDDIVSALSGRLQRRRFITIVGPGGVGKTTVALAMAAGLSTSYEDGVCFIDLAPLADPLLVPSALAAALGLAVIAEDPTEGVIAFLRDRRMLVVCDSCEQVVEAAAVLVEKVLKGAPGVDVLATSREPLRAEGEGVHRLPPLETPAKSTDLTAAEALTFPAVQLLLERAASCVAEFELADADAPVVADICRRLDGIPLAIELAAGRIDAFGLRGVAARLDDRFRLLMHGRRTALPRHQTLSATLDWSYESLPASERTVLCRLAVFVGAFALQAASTVVADEDITAQDVADLVATLVEKSLVGADLTEAMGVYRLLDTTRAYALGKLAESRELEQVARRHAEYYRDIFAQAEAEWEIRPRAEWLAVYGRQIDNVRAALDWAYSQNGDAAIGVALTVAAVPLWFQLSLIEECRGRVEQGLSHLRAGAVQDQHQVMQLFAALGGVLMNTTGAGPEMNAAWTNVLDLAERLDDPDYRLRALWGLWVDHRNRGEYREAMAAARRFRSIAAGIGHPADLSVSDRMIGVSLHYLGDQIHAREHIERMLRRDVTPIHQLDILRFQFDQRVAARCFLGLILLLQGFPDQARSTVESNVDAALATHHEISLAYALSEGACPVALFVGDLTAAERFVAMLLERAERHRLGVWHSLGRCFGGVLLIKCGEAGAGLPLLRAALNELRSARSAPRYTSALGELAQALGDDGQTSEGLKAIGRGARALRAQRRALVHRGAPARQGRARTPGGRAQCRQRSRGDFPEVAPLGAPTGRSGVGVAHGHKPRSTGA